MRTADEVLRWAALAFPTDRLAVASAFGPGTTVVIDLLDRIGARVPVIFIDTLYHFPETLEHVERVRARYGLDLRVFRPAENREAFESLHGARLWDRDLDRYQQLTKVEPFRRAIAELDAFVTGRRRDQSPTRNGIAVIEPGTPIRINPIAEWTGAQVWRYIYEHRLPYNPLHDAGYASVGDKPLTTPVQPHEPERAGRWRGLGRLECGIHTLSAEA